MGEQSQPQAHTRDSAAASHQVAPTIVVLDDPSSPAQPNAWAAAFDDARWDGAVVAPTPAGWHDAPPIVGGNYDVSDPIFDLIQLSVSGRVPGLEPSPSGGRVRGRVAAVVGIGLAGWSATLWALAGRAAGLVLIDGSGGPWRSTEERNHRRSELLRAQRNAGLEPQEVHSVAGLTDPRRLLPPAPLGNRALALDAAGALVAEGVPTCLGVTPTPRAEGVAVAASADSELAQHLGVEVTAFASRGPESAAKILHWVSAQDFA